MRAISRLPLTLFASLPLLLVPDPGRADVTIQQQTQFDFVLIKSHGSRTELITPDKRRSDSEMHCEGLMSMFCGNSQSAQIIRLDRNLEWALEPKKREYRETPLPTAAQILAARQEAQAMMEKVKQCPAMTQRSPPGPDTSKCEMSPPRVDVKQPGTHASLAGHDTQLTQIALTNSCTNKATGEVCDFVFALDSWLTQDQIAGLEDQKAFMQAYQAKLGLDPRDPATQQQMRQFLAPYADVLKQLSARSDELKGYPLKTVLRIAYGGEHCAAIKNQPAGGGGNAVVDASQAAGNAATASAASTAGSAAGAAAANASKNSLGSSIFSSAASAFGSKLTSSLFKKKADTASATTTTGAADNGLPPGMVQAAQITVETTSIDAAPVPAEKFELPVGWKKVEPRAKEAGSKEFSCPSPGS
ncbi:MAG TPA: hypothetical protein VMT66_09850 [Steroidobacteraceae bacterium]|nr:hypothetical protein [Steroidobacteraceae bacterium]